MRRVYIPCTTWMLAVCSEMLCRYVALAVWEGKGLIALFACLFICLFVTLYVDHSGFELVILLPADF